MPWIRLDDRFPEHPKIVRAGPLGLALWVSAIAYCNRNLTDGFVPRSVASHLLEWTLEDDGGTPWEIGISSPDNGAGFGTGMDVDADLVLERLVACGLLRVVDGGFVIHDYLDYQPSGEQVRHDREELSRKRAEAGRKGAAARWRNGKNGKTEPMAKSPFAIEEEAILPMANEPSEQGEMANAMAKAWPQPQEEQDQTLLSGKPDRRKPKTTKPRRRDELFDEVTSVLGIDPTTLTPSGRGPLNKALSELRSVGATADQIRPRFDAYLKRFPDAACTASALAKHWGSLGNGNGAAGPMMAANQKTWRPS